MGGIPEQAGGGLEGSSLSIRLVKVFIPGTFFH